MLDLSSYLLFLVASGAIILVPGPAQALVFAKTLSGGQRAGALTAVGVSGVVLIALGLRLAVQSR
jgi:threonine/homoserine/homoserine lactone efflux protein